MFCDLCGARIDGGACPSCGTATHREAPPSRAAPAQRVRGPRSLSWLTRHLAGNLTALVCAWFNVPFALLMAALGAILGAISGIGAGTDAGAGLLSRVDVFLRFVLPLPIDAADLLPSAAFQLGGVVGAILGALQGAAVFTFMAVAGLFQTLHDADPTWPYAFVAGQVATAVGVAAATTAFLSATEGWRLGQTGPRRPSRREMRLLGPLVEDAARRMGASTAPALLIDDDRRPNAYAGMRHVIVNRGLVEHLGGDRPALAAVIAHEVAHVRRGDAVALAWGKGVGLPLVAVYNLAAAAERRARWRPLQFLIAALTWSVTLTVRRIVMPLQAADWRRSEFAADSMARDAGFGPDLHRALSLLQGFDGVRSGWDAAVLSTHPPAELRLERLEEPGRDYPLAADARPVFSRPSAVPPRTGPPKD
ncbi:M48 family metalloprotease [Nocardiopsis coralliicola]